MNFPVSPRELKAISVLAEELHFGRAALRLNMAQPQLSHLVKRVEEAVGLTLFIRRPTVQLTPGGTVLIEALRRLERDLGTSIAEARAIAAGKKGSIHIGFSDAAMLTELPAALHRFAKTTPDVVLRLTEGHSEQLLEQLSHGAFDLVITRQTSDDPAVTSVRLIEDKVVLAVPEGHPAAAKKSVKLAELQNETVLIFRRSAAPKYYDRLVSAGHSAGFFPSAIQEVDTRSASLALVAAGSGVAFATAASQRIGHPGVRFCKIADPMPDASFWASYNEGSLSAAAFQAVEFIRSALSQVRSR
jgi:DNA-binding transcriptional LysR family regulator